MNTIKFQVGQSYIKGDYTITVLSRTEKTLMVGTGAKVGIQVIDGVEVTRKGGTSRFVARADKPA